MSSPEHRKVPRIMLTCQECGVTFERLACQLKPDGRGVKGRYCSRACRARAVMRERMRDPEYRSKAKGRKKIARVSLTCRHCGSPFELLACQIKRMGEGSYCSRHCRAAANGERLKDNPDFAYKLRSISLKNGNRPPLHNGARHWNWKGGITRPRYIERGNGPYRLWRIAVLGRDNYTCQQCGKRGGRLVAHHVKLWSQHPDLRYEVTNGQTLCKACHDTLHGLTPRNQRSGASQLTLWDMGAG